MRTICTCDFCQHLEVGSENQMPQTIHSFLTVWSELCAVETTQSYRKKQFHIRAVQRMMKKHQEVALSFRLLKKHRAKVYCKIMKNYNYNH